MDIRTMLGYGPFHIKGKVHPITCHEGTEGEYRYSCALSLTSVLDGGGWLTSDPGHFTPGNGLVTTV
jgi:hypothetical protein